MQFWRKLLRYRHQKGCGVLGFSLPQSWIYNESCVTHDNFYIKGGSKRDRLVSDLIFLKDMILEIEFREPGYWRMRGYIIIAVIYFFLVRVFGWIFWESE